jgi:hypothetical protein
MMEAVRTSETSVDNHFTRQYNPEDSSELIYEHLELNCLCLHFFALVVERALLQTSCCY